MGTHFLIQNHILPWFPDVSFHLLPGAIQHSDFQPRSHLQDFFSHQPFIAGSGPCNSAFHWWSCQEAEEGLVCVKVSNELYFFIAQQSDQFPSAPPPSSGSGTCEGTGWCNSNCEIAREEMGAPWAKNFLNQLCYRVQKSKKKL